MIIPPFPVPQLPPQCSSYFPPPEAGASIFHYFQLLFSQAQNLSSYWPARFVSHPSHVTRFVVAETGLVGSQTSQPVSHRQVSWFRWEIHASFSRLLPFFSLFLFSLSCYGRLFVFFAPRYLFLALVSQRLYRLRMHERSGLARPIQHRQAC